MPRVKTQKEKEEEFKQFKKLQEEVKQKPSFYIAKHENRGALNKRNIDTIFTNIDILEKRITANKRKNEAAVASNDEHIKVNISDIAAIRAANEENKRQIEEMTKRFDMLVKQLRSLSDRSKTNEAAKTLANMSTKNIKL